MPIQKNHYMRDKVPFPRYCHIYVCETRFMKTCLNTLNSFLRYRPFSSAESKNFFVNVHRIMSLAPPGKL